MVTEKVWNTGFIYKKQEFAYPFGQIWSKNSELPV